jgi:uncharacterized membrane protein (DUF485 family)
VSSPIPPDNADAAESEDKPRPVIAPDEPAETPGESAAEVPAAAVPAAAAAPAEAVPVEAVPVEAVPESPDEALGEEAPIEELSAPTTAQYLAVEESPDFARLRHTLRRFVFPATAAFLLWYALYVLLSAFARGFMSTVLFGHINVALVFGLLQFVTTFLLAWYYGRYMSRRFDPLSETLRARVEQGVDR